MEIKNGKVQLGGLGVISLITFLLCLIGDVSTHAQIHQSQHQTVFPAESGNSHYLSRLSLIVEDATDIKCKVIRFTYASLMPNFGLAPSQSLINIAFLRQFIALLNFVHQTYLSFNPYVYQETSLA